MKINIEVDPEDIATVTKLVIAEYPSLVKNIFTTLINRSGR